MHHQVMHLTYFCPIPDGNPPNIRMMNGIAPPKILNAKIANTTVLRSQFPLQQKNTNATNTEIIVTFNCKSLSFQSNSSTNSTISSSMVGLGGGGGTIRGASTNGSS